MMGFTYRGIHSSEFGLVVRTNPSLLPEFENRYVKVPGSLETIYGGTDYKSKPIPFEVGFVEDNLIEYSEKLRLLSDWLRPDKGVGELIADYEPDKIHYAILEEGGINRIENIARMGRGVLKFVSPDPTGYGANRVDRFETNKIVRNEGTVETHPTIKVNVEEDTPIITLTNSSNRNKNNDAPKEIILGRPYSPAQDLIEPKTLILHDSMRSTQSWQNAQEVDDGYIAGEIDVNQYGFYPRLFGSAIDMKRWQGPSLIKAIGQPLQDFKADILIRQFNSAAETGMLEVYFRDANGNTVAKIGMGDAWVNTKQNMGHIKIGPSGKQQTLRLLASPSSGWNDYDGILRIKRIGNLWIPYFAKIQPDGKHIWVSSTKRIRDNDRVAMAPITHVQVAFRVYPGSKPTSQAIKEIKVFKVNNGVIKEEEVPITFKAGDVVEITNNSGKDMVYVNGEPSLEVVDVKSDFFTLVSGANNLTVEPSNFPVEVRWRERYL